MNSVYGDQVDPDFSTFSNSDWNAYFKNLMYESALETQNYQMSAAKKNINKDKNRYLDVLPYDHTRVMLCHDALQDVDSDYINANLVCVPNPVNEIDLRQYILTQGPLCTTASHFWLMVWQQKSKAIIMLNNIIEKGVQKCYPYFPCGYIAGGVEEHEYEDVHLIVRYMEEENFGFYIKRTFQITDTVRDCSRTVLHFHYLTWPDFGVPRSYGSFLNFVWAVRASGALNHEVHGPVVIHCSAGIGRSGTFVMIDSTLAIVELTDNRESVDIKQLLQDIRKQRVGLIQSYEQLSFSYAAINFGCKILLESDKAQRENIKFPMSENDITTDSVDGVTKFMNGANSVSYSNSEILHENSFNQFLSNENNMECDVPDNKNSDSNSFYSTPEERRKIRALRQTKNKANVEELKKRIKEEKLHRWRHSLPVQLGIGAVIAGGVAAVLYYFWPSSNES